MSFLHIRLFGRFRITHQGEQVANAKLTRGIQALLAYLLLHRHRVHPRERLIGLFWGDHQEERARSCLSTALWRLRQVLEPAGVLKGTYLVSTPTGEIGFNPESDYWLDVAQLEETVSRSLASPALDLDFVDASELESIVMLYNGELLEGFYDDWVQIERERFRSLYLKGISHLMQYHRYNKNFEQSLVCGQKILGHDPLREEIHQEMMRVYLESGQRSMAVRQYKACSEILEKELGVPPMVETQALYAEILKPTSHEQSRSIVGKVKGKTRDKVIGARLEQAGGLENEKDITALPEAFRKLTTAMQDFENSREELQQAINLLKRALGEQVFQKAR